MLLLIAFSTALESNGDDHGPCKKITLDPRPHSVSILEFGAVGDGKTLNTVAFQNAVFYAKSFADKGGAQLYVPSGKWLTGSFNLTSHLTLFLEKGATIIASQVFIFNFSPLSINLLISYKKLQGIPYKFVSCTLSQLCQEKFNHDGKFM